MQAQEQEQVLVKQARLQQRALSPAACAGTRMQELDADDMHFVPQANRRHGGGKLSSWCSKKLSKLWLKSGRKSNHASNVSSPTSNDSSPTLNSVESPSSPPFANDEHPAPLQLAARQSGASGQACDAFARRTVSWHKETVQHNDLDLSGHGRWSTCNSFWRSPGNPNSMQDTMSCDARTLCENRVRSFVKNVFLSEDEQTRPARGRSVE